jgi:hypothetical protein
MTRAFTRQAVAPVRRAVDVEDLLFWTYHRQQAHVAIPLSDAAVSLRGPRGARSGFDRIAWIERLGCIPDLGTPNPGTLPPDAELVAEYVATMGGLCQMLLVRHGRRGDRPDWGGGYPARMEPVWRLGKQPARDHRGWPLKGRFKMVYDSNRHPLYCPVVAVYGAAWHEELRADYTAWFAGLLAVLGRFGAETLQRFQVTGPRAPARPWDAAEGDGGVEAAETNSTETLDKAHFA